MSGGRFCRFIFRRFSASYACGGGKERASDEKTTRYDRFAMKLRPFMQWWT